MSGKRNKVHWLVVALIFSPLTMGYHCGGDGGEEISTSISGRITTSDGKGVSDISVQAFGAPVDATPGCGDVRGTTTDASGFYKISDTGSEISSAEVHITPSSNNYRFDPQERSTTINYGEHLSGYDFLATQVYSISGSIVTSDGTGVPSVTVNLMSGDSVYATTATSESGSYIFPDVPVGTYTIIPTGLVFIPVSRTVTVVDGTPPSDLSGQDFLMV